MSHKRPRKVQRSHAFKLSRKQLYAVAIITVIAVSSLAIYAFFTQGSSSQFKAAIVDQLSSREDFKNATFVKTANATLTVAGYMVTYYKGSEVTVDFYRNLPKQGYKVVILRVHSALYNGTDAPLDLFTSEPFNPNDPDTIYYLSRGYLDAAMYQQGGDQFFGIKHSFISNAMLGNFDDAVIIMMGCNGLDKYARSKATLDAFLGKGAKVVIGWDDAVGVDHTDIATAALLRRLLIENQTIKNAVNATNMDVGPDPTYHSVLKYYPSTSSIDSYTVPHSLSKSTNVTDAFSIFGTMIFSALPVLLYMKKFLVSKGLECRLFEFLVML